MADSSVAITAGSGTSIDTRTEATNGNHRQVIVVGDPSTNAGVAPVDATAGLKVDLGADNDVTVASLPLPTGASTSAKQDTQITAEQAIQTSVELIDDAVKADDAAFTPATTKVVMSGFEYDDTSPDVVDEGDAGAARMSARREVYTQIRDAAGNERGINVDANGEIGIGAVRTSVTPGTSAAHLGKAEDNAHASGDTGVAVWGVRQDIPNATAAASGDYHYLATDMVGGLRTALYETDFAVLGTNHVKKYYTNAGAVTDGIVWSPAAGKRWYVTDLIISVSAATTVLIEDDKVGGDEAVMKLDLAANSGLVVPFRTPLFSGEDAADLLVTTSAGNIYITAVGYEV